MDRRSRVFALVLGMAALSAAPALAQDGSPAAGTWTVVAEGLDAPRGLAWGSDGALLVAIAGEGGEQCMEVEGPEGPMDACMGPTGGVVSVDVATGTVMPVVSGLLSLAAETEVIGPPDVVVGADGSVYLVTPDGNVPDAAERAEGDMGGMLWKLDADGAPQPAADVWAYEKDSNPDGGELDTNPNSVAVAPDGSVLVVDAGANALLMVAADGTITTGAVFPPTMVPAPPMPGSSPDPAASPAMMPMQAVPTSVTIGPDGAAYVGQLTGYPFVPGAASVWKVESGKDPVVYASGFTNIMDLAFAPDGTLWVVEFAHDGMMAGPGPGGLLSVPAGGGDPTLVATDGLVAPGGVAVGADGAVYVSNGSVMPNGGSIVKLNQ
jgi:sugar lactone lactonase YvrE